MNNVISKCALVIFIATLASCSWKNDKELTTQGNLDNYHYGSGGGHGGGHGGKDGLNQPIPNAGMHGANGIREDSVFTAGEQEPQNIITSDVKLLYINTAPFKFYDYARLNTYKSGLVKLELFKYAQTMGSIRIKSGRMCVLTECSYKWPISKKFFGSVSYGNLFEDIIFSKDIFGGRGKQILGPNQVIQRFQQSGEIIYYERSPGHTLFKNMTTGVTIGLDNYEAPENAMQNFMTIPQ